MRLCRSFIAVLAMVLGSSSATAQTLVLKSLMSDFKTMEFDSLHLTSNNSFDEDMNALCTVQSAFVDLLEFDFPITPTDRLMHKAVGSFQLTKKINAYLIRSWFENKREYQTVLCVVQIKGHSYSVINQYLVGIGMGSECCEHLTDLFVVDYNEDGYFDLVINEYQRETNTTETKTIENRSIYLWDQKDFKLHNISRIERYECN